MISRLMHLLLLAVSGALAFGAPGCARAEAHWQVLTNPYFRGLTNADADRAVGLMEEMDRFRIAIQKIANVKLPADAPPALVIIFGSTGEFRRYSRSRSVGGFAVAAADTLPKPTIVLPASGTSLDEMQTIRHEYVHALNRHRLVAFPKWYEEGIAEVFSLAKIDGADIVVGLPPKKRFENLSNASAYGLDTWRSFDDIVSGDLPTHGFVAYDAYAQYWLLTHYLTFGRPDLRKELDRCLILSDGMMKPLDAFRSSFGTTPEEMWKTGGMKTYAQKMPSNRYTLTKPIVAERFTVAPADPAEVQGVLAALNEYLASKRKDDGD